MMFSVLLHWITKLPDLVREVFWQLVTATTGSSMFTVSDSLTVIIKDLNNEYIKGCLIFGTGVIILKLVLK